MWHLPVLEFLQNSHLKPRALNPFSNRQAEAACLLIAFVESPPRQVMCQLKALSIGTSLDVEVIRRMRLEGTRPLLAYWKKDLKLSASNGYSVKIQGQEDATFMRGLPNLTDTSLFRFAIDVEQLPRFARPTLGRPRKGNVYKAPLALVKGFPGLSREAGWAQLSFSDVGFKQNWF